MSKKSAILVILQIAAMILLIWFNKPISSGFGLIVQAFGILIGIWAIIAVRIGNFNIQPEVKSNILIVKGPYKWIRNPMYTAVILFYLPIVIQNLNLLNIVVFILLFAILILKIISEEHYLEERFNSLYLEYKKGTKKLLPFIY